MTGAATALPAGLSWEPFLELLDQDEYRNAELIDGQVVVVTPSWIHQRIVTTLIWLIRNWVAAGEGRGEVTVNPRVKITHNRGYLPDLAVEVLSPSTRTFDLVRKRADYARIGVGELWLIDPDGRTALILRRGGSEFVLAEDLDADNALTSPRLPGLSIVVGQLVAL